MVLLVGLMDTLGSPCKLITTEKPMVMSLSLSPTRLIKVLVMSPSVMVTWSSTTSLTMEALRILPYHQETTITVTTTHQVSGKTIVEPLKSPVLDSSTTEVTVNVLTVTRSGETSELTEYILKLIPYILRVRSGLSIPGMVRPSLSR